MSYLSDRTSLVVEEVLAGGGEMGALVRALDWATTPVGPAERWPQSLRTAVSILLSSRFPMIIFWGPDLVQFYNDAYRPILGATKHPAALGQCAHDCWPEIWDVIGPMLHGVLATGVATWSDDQLLLIDRNGYVEECYFTFSYSPIRDETGGVGGVFCAVTETTGRVLGERRLRTLRELAAQTADARTAEAVCGRAAAALAGNPADLPLVLLYLLDVDGGHAHLTGTAGIAPGTTASPLLADLAPDAGPGAPWPLAQVLRTGQPALLTDLATQLGPVSVGGHSLRAALVLPVAQTGQERPAGFLVVGLSPRHALDEEYRGFFDLVAGQIAAAIGDARAHEEERRRAEALAELDRSKTAFFSNVSHEFRTPLTLLLGPLEDLLANPADLHGPQGHEQLAVAHRNGLRLLRLVNTLLDFSRIEAGRVQASYEPTDLAILTADLASSFRAAVERAGLRLVVDCPPLPAPVYVDREMWEKIVLNLLSNAFKFTFEGEIAVTLRPAGETVTLTVRDTGSGIPAEALPRLFERFHRVHGARARTQEGTGIGLALVQELIQLHGGTVEVTSVVGEGSTFTITLPLGTAHLPADRIGAPRTLASTGLGAAPYVEEALRWLPETPAAAEEHVLIAGAGLIATPPEEASSGSVSPARILLADDNADMRDYLTRLLGPRYQVQAVADGATALSAALAAPPDLVLSDIMMPGLDGVALLRALRADPRTCLVPVILLSARAGEEEASEGLDAGADDYLVKPFAARELLARVRTNLALARQRLQLAKDREHLLQVLALGRDRLQQVLDVLPEAVQIVDTQGRFVLSNRAANALLGADMTGTMLPGGETDASQGYSLTQLDGTPYPSPELPLQRALRGEEVHGHQQLLRHATTGRDIPLLVNTAPLRDQTGAIAGAVKVFQDISPLKELERQRDEFLAIVSHDLKNPLTAILGMSGILRRRAARLADPDGARLVEGLGTIIQAAEGMTGQINELLDSTRLQMGRPLDLDLRPTDLVALLVRLIAEHDESSERHTVRMETAERALVGLYDEARLGRAVVNVLGNAIRYSPQGGIITVALTCEEEPSGAWVTIRIADPGEGIPAAELPRVFERFYRASNVVGRIAGTGVGLAGVRQIVEQHGGSIVLESEEGRGTTATIRLPHRPPPVMEPTRRRGA